MGQGHLSKTWNKRSARLMAASVLAVSVAAAIPVSTKAANITTTWSGATGDWFDPAQWSAGVPATGSDLYLPVINSGGVTLNASVTTSGLTLGAPALFTLGSGNSYVVAPSFGGSSSISGMATLQAAAFLDVSDSITFTNATVNGDGTYRQLAGMATLLGASNFNNLVIDGGAILQGAGSLTIGNHADLLNFGNFASNTSILLTTGATLHFDSPNALQFLNGRYTLAGTTIVSGTGLYNGNGTVINSGTFTLGGAGQSPTFGPVVFTSTGVLNLASGTLNLGSSVTHLGGLISAGTASALLINNATLFDGAVLSAADGGRFSAAASTTIAGNATADHFAFASLVGAGTLTLLGNNSWSGGILSGPQLLIGGSATLLLTGNGQINSGTLTNNGTLLTGYWPASGQTFPGSIFVNSPGRLVNTGTIEVESSINGAGTLTNSGLITVGNTASTAKRGLLPFVVNSGTISGFFSLTSMLNTGLVSGTHTLSGTLTNAGTFTGSGGITGPTYNTGIISGQITLANGSSSGLLSGDSAAGPGTLTITGGYTLTHGAVISSVGGTVNFQGPITLVNESSVDHMVFNSITNSGTLDLSGPNNWLSGTVTNSAPAAPVNVHVLPQGALLLGNQTANTSLVMVGGALLNEGTIGNSFPVSTTLTLNNAILQNTGTITLNSGGGLFNSTIGISGSGTGSIFSTGFINSSGSESITALLYNAGTLTNSGTTLTITPVLTTLNASASGMFVASGTSSAVNFADQSHPYLLNGASLTGPGTFSGWVQVAGSVTASNVNFTSLTGTGSMDVSGSMVLANSYAIHNATVRLLPTGTLTQSPGNPTGTFTLDNASLILQSAATQLFGTITLAGSAELINEGIITGKFGTVSVVGATTSQFINAGLINCSSNLSINVPFFNSGTVTTSGSGSITLSAGGKSTGLLTATNSFSGGINCGPGFVLDNATLSGSRIGGAFILLGQNTADTTQLGAGLFSTAPGITLSGSGTLTVSNQITFNGSASACVANGAHLIVAPSGTLSLQPTPLATTIDNASLLNLGVAVIPFGSINTGIFFKLANGATFTNAGSISLSFSLPNTLYSFDSDGSPQNAFLNSGVIAVSASGGSIGIAPPFYNSGTLTNTQRGFPGAVVNIAGGGSSSGLFQSTPVQTITQGTGIAFSAPYTLDGATVSGYIVVSAPVTLRNTVAAINPFNGGAGSTTGLFISNNLNGPGTLAGGGMVWASGTISNAGGVIVNTTSNTRFIDSPSHPVQVSFLISNGKPAGTTRILDGVPLTIGSGQLAAWTAGTINGLLTPDQISLRNGAQIINNGSFYSYLASTTFANADNHSANAFINNGVFGRSSLTQSGTPNVTTFAVPFHNTGVVDIQQGQIDFAGGYFNENPLTANTAEFRFAAGTGLYFSGGNYDFGDSPFVLGAGGLFGTGTVHGNFISAGTISPGNSPGTLTLNGDLALAPGATLTLEISFAGPSPQFDLLTVHGNFTAGGALTLHILGGTPDSTEFDPLVADSFFGVFDGLPDGSRIFDSGGAGSYLVTYTPEGIVLSGFEVSPVPEPLTLVLLAPALLALLVRRNIKTQA